MEYFYNFHENVCDNVISAVNDTTNRKVENQLSSPRLENEAGVQR